MPDNERLNGFVNEIAAEKGIKTVGAEYCKFAKITYHAYSVRNVYRFRISDYLSTAPDDVLKDYLDTMMSNLKKKQRKPSGKFMDWMLSDEFVSQWRPVRIQRSKNISRGTVGKARDLGASLDRLMDMGLVYDSDIKNSYYTWTSRPNHRKVGECDLAFRIVTISSVLDSENVPEKVLDYVVYHETVHLRIGHRQGESAHGKKFKELENLYPDIEWCERYLSENLKKK